MSDRVTAAIGGCDEVLERCEPVFLSSHAIHHLELMLEIGRGAGVAVDGKLGLAFSTAAHRAATG